MIDLLIELQQLKCSYECPYYNNSSKNNILGARCIVLCYTITLCYFTSYCIT